jgi:purine-binding chemotaxis protein CheW
VALRVERAYAVTDILPLTGKEAAGFRNDAVTGYGTTRSGPADQDEIVSLLDIERLLRSFLPSSSVPGV